MGYIWFLIFSCSIFIAAIIGWVRYSSIAPAYYPFLVCVWIGSVNELISIIFPQFGYTTDINNNIYVLLEAILLLWQLRQWEAMNGRGFIFPGMIAIIISGWILENFIFSSLSNTHPWFRLEYSFLIVICSIQVINRLIVSETRSLVRHPAFLICTGFVLFFTYKLLVELCWIKGFPSSRPFLMNVYSILIWINLLVNILYAFAILCMPARQRFTWPS